MNCPKCNSIAEQGEVFCTKCGYNLNQTVSQNNQEIENIIQNSNSEESIKSDITKYLKKCYIPFAIIFCIYMIANGKIQLCYNETIDSTLPCSIMHLFNEVFFLIANFAIVLPFVISSTKKLLKKFNTHESKFKIVDSMIVVLTSITTVLLTSKINIFSFFLIPIIILIYFSKDYISKKISKKIYFLIILSLLITSFTTGYVFYKIIIIYNIMVIPTISIIFYLLNHCKIKFKSHKLISFSLVLFLLVFSSYQYLLKNNKSFIEDIKKENINLEYKDVSHLHDIVYADNEKIYIISAEGIYYDDMHYLSKYNIKNNKFEVLFSNVKEAISKDELLFFNKNNDIYMLNTQNDEVKKIVNKKYYGDTYHYMDYDNGNLYFSSNNTVYCYNVSNSKITSFMIDKDESIKGIFGNLIITQTYNSNRDYYSYVYNGQKTRLSNLPSYLSFDSSNNPFVHENYLYSTTYKDDIIVINNLEEQQSYEYKINLNDIYKDEMQQNNFERIESLKFLGAYEDKMYIQLKYRINNNNLEFNTEYENIYYFDISDFNETNNFKLNVINDTFESNSSMNAYLLDNYIYLSNYKNGRMYKYNLDNNNVTSYFAERECCFFENSYGNYIYASNLNDDIFRIDKNNLKTEKILIEN